MITQIKKGILEMCVLQSLLAEDKYGYAISSEISKHIDIAEGTVYPILKRLSKNLYLSTYLKESNIGPPRKYYKLTPLGLKRLKQAKSDWIYLSHEVNRFLNLDTHT